MRITTKERRVNNSRDDTKITKVGRLKCPLLYSLYLRYKTFKSPKYIYRINVYYMEMIGHFQKQEYGLMYKTYLNLLNTVLKLEPYKNKGFNKPTTALEKYKFSKFLDAVACNLLNKDLMIFTLNTAEDYLESQLIYRIFQELNLSYVTTQGWLEFEEFMNVIEDNIDVDIVARD